LIVHKQINYWNTKIWDTTGIFRREVEEEKQSLRFDHAEGSGNHGGEFLGTSSTEGATDLIGMRWMPVFFID